jgi:hypothetical protein
LSIAVTIQNMTIAGTVAAGGNGGDGENGGGGGAGLGGAIFIGSQANVMLANGIRRMQFSRQGLLESGLGALALRLPDQTLAFKQVDWRLNVYRREGDYRPFFQSMYRRELTDGHIRTFANFSDVPGADFVVAGIPIPENRVRGPRRAHDGDVPRRDDLPVPVQHRPGAAAAFGRFPAALVGWGRRAEEPSPAGARLHPSWMPA